ncbi:hypothetical protein CC117_11165 [Parafrankia colletiae]|uniref:Beta-ketoacyl synthase-like N-terminal domain-containing protein n=1 Tax=Parafrankia colletiae TaxID=573497 RepID=A0A1S1R8A6_9ACTN|nr:hypothetical protein [Frankia sp. Cpl3]OHV43168.1 hypothetical protein CC117_11165 [Parafrankia colletiae]
MVTVEGRESAVAVVGMGCELPSARGPRELWRLLAQARDAVGPGRAGTGLRQAGHIDGAGCSDLTRFGIDPDEAAWLDPQQHLLLRVAYDAIADAGLDPAGIAGSPTAVCVGQSASDYGADRR